MPRSLLNLSLASSASTKVLTESASKLIVLVREINDPGVVSLGVVGVGREA